MILKINIEIESQNCKSKLRTKNWKLKIGKCQLKIGKCQLKIRKCQSKIEIKIKMVMENGNFSCKYKFRSRLSFLSKLLSNYYLYYSLLIWISKKNIEAKTQSKWSQILSINFFIFANFFHKTAVYFIQFTSNTLWINSLKVQNSQKLYKILYLWYNHSDNQI